MGSRQWNPRFKKQVILLTGLLVVTVFASVFWWLRSKAQDDSAIPARLCNDTFSSAQVKPSYGRVHGEFEEDTVRGFPGVLEKARGLGVVCETSAGNMSVNFRVQYTQWGKSRSEVERNSKYVAEFGAGYGEYGAEKGSISLRVPCPSSEEPNARMYLHVGATSARGGSREDVSKLAELTGYAARTLAQKVYKCKGAEELPEGPVVITEGEGRR
ncbi:hypothetical protein [Streptomyces sp. WMMB303]|uniref:hypothetical protein n=1 Tax=Streptomyces sp. WMMB303 TaxID=3034154 RepID=UPI0023EC4A89|nr:hypothetical protein [Streptomyces sp. WMMB303]MDF4251120.1 hypothetical protein [Streptomyces sp. WMMB303]